MKFSSLIFSTGLLATSISAFTPSHSTKNVFQPQSSYNKNAIIAELSPTKSALHVSTLSDTGLINIADEYAQRDVYSMDEWAQQYGMQKVDGVEIFTADGADFQLMTNAPIAGGSTVLYVPSNMVLSSNNIAEEFGGSLEAAENALVAMENGLAQRLPLFRLMVKILSEYEQGQNSPFFPWLNSVPRMFYNGVAMTDACFDCLPPYAKLLTMNERNTYSRFVNAIRKGYVPLAESTIMDDRIVKWAYNVALTRFHEVWQPVRQKHIAPMADMLNHNTYPNCEITFDQEGNCIVQASYDIQPGTALTISLGDPTNPTPLFAKYGFLDSDCKTIFCKAVHLEAQIEALGYDYKDLLFQTESGEIAPQVWDIFLYEILQMNDPESADQFYVACKTNDEGTKQQFHDTWFQYTLQALKNHIYSILQDVEQLTMTAQSYDLETHPRVPVIVAHNTLVRDTFTMTAQLLEQMG